MELICLLLILLDWMLRLVERLSLFKLIDGAWREMEANLTYELVGTSLGSLIIRGPKPDDTFKFSLVEPAAIFGTMLP